MRCAFCFTLCGFGAHAAPLAPQRLRVEHAPAPRGVASGAPSFSFALAHTERAQAAASFELLVERLDAASGARSTAWAANISASAGARSTGLPYNSDGGGEALLADTDYSWRARWVADGGGGGGGKAEWSPWSADARFSTALLAEADWRGATWIGTDGPGGAAPYIDADDKYRFRIETRVGVADGVGGKAAAAAATRGAVQRCSLMITGLGYYRAALEGVPLDDHELGESTQFQRRIPYDNVDCLPALRKALAQQRRRQQRRRQQRAGNGDGDVPIALTIELGRGLYGEELVGPLSNQPSGPRLLRCLLTLTYADGSAQRLSSDPADPAVGGDGGGVGGGAGAALRWRRGRGPVVWEQLHRGIVYDARRETAGWQRAGFDDSGWLAVNRSIDITCANVSGCADSTVGYGNLAHGNLVPMLHPRIRKTRALRPAAVTSLNATRALVDLGENIAGWCRYRLTPATAGGGGGGGGNVTFMHAEYLDAATGSVTRRVQPLVKGVNETSVYVMRDGGAAFEYEPVFVSYGFRYVQIDGPLLAPAPGDITCWTVHTDFERVGDFAFLPPPPLPTDAADAAAASARSSSAPSPRLQQLALQQRLLANYNATVATADANWISFPTDCPHRERRGWLGDAQAAAETLLSRYDATAGYAKWLDDVADAADVQYSNGNIGTIAPQFGAGATARRPARSATETTPPAWSAAYVLVWDWTWRRAGDLALAARHYGRAKAYVDFLGAHRDSATHVLRVDWSSHLLGDWCAALGVNGTGVAPDAPAGDYPWSSYTARHASGVFNTFYYIRAHEALLRAHAALGKPDAEAAPVRARLAAARSGFNFAFWHAANGTYADPMVAADPARYGAEPLQTALSLALVLGVAELPHVNATAAVRAALLRDVVVTSGGRMTAGLIGTKYLFPALARVPGGAGMDAALNVLAGYGPAGAERPAESPSYGYMLAQGPGTLWESPDGNASWHRPRGSLNHIMLGGHAGPFFFGELGGITLPDDSVGWSTVRIAPALTPRLSGFRASLLTAAGRIATAWAWQRAAPSPDPAGGFALNVSIPVGSRANVSFPATAAVREGGVLVWGAAGLVPGAVPGVLGGAAEAGGAVRLEVASGDYAFAAATTS